MRCHTLKIEVAAGGRFAGVDRGVETIAFALTAEILRAAASRCFSGSDAGFLARRSIVVRYEKLCETYSTFGQFLHQHYRLCYRLS